MSKKTKKAMSMLFVVTLIAVIAVGGMLAYLTSESNDVNVMTLGNVEIEQHEMQRAEGVAHNAGEAGAGNGVKEGALVPFKQGQGLYPAVPSGDLPYTAESKDLFYWGDYVYSGTAGNGLWNDDKLQNVMDKMIFVENTGKSDCYYRTLIAFECPEGMEYSEGADKEFMMNVSGSSLYVWDEVGYVEIDGTRYLVTYATYQNALAPGNTAHPSLLQVVMTHNATNEDMELLGDTYEILALSQAVQTQGFDNPETALNTAWGDVTEAKVIEWFTGMRLEVEVEGNNAAALTKAIADAPEGATLVLEDDIDFGSNTFTVEKNVNIDLNGNTVSSNARNGAFYLKNGASLENGTVQHNGTVAGIKVWQSESIKDVEVILNGKSASNNPITGISLQAGNTSIKSMKNVTVRSTGDNVVYNGIETYNCGDRTDFAIDSMENVKVDVNGTAFMLSAPVGTATNCEFKGGEYGINAHLKGTYNVSAKLVDCKVEGGTKGIIAWDEPAASNPGSLKLIGENTTVVGGVESNPAESFGERWSVIGF